MLRISNLLVALALTACAVNPTLDPLVTHGTLGSGANMSSSTDGFRWSVMLHGSKLLLQRDGMRFEVLGATSADGHVDFVHTAGTSEWQFFVADGRTLSWTGREVVLDDRRWLGAMGELQRIKI